MALLFFKYTCQNLFWPKLILTSLETTVVNSCLLLLKPSSKEASLKGKNLLIPYFEKESQLKRAKLLPLKLKHMLCPLIDLGPLVQSIVCLTSSLRGQLVKCFGT